MRIELVIDDLVLHGFDPRHGRAIADAVQGELAVLLSARAAALHDRPSMDAARIDAGTFGVGTDASTARLGTIIAKAVAVAIAPELHDAPSRVDQRVPPIIGKVR